MAEFALQKQTDGAYDEVLARLPELLKAEGFGVLTRIDVQSTLKEKLGVSFRRYQILGACNPQLAHRALSAVLDVGTMLPCNVVCYEADDGRTVVLAVDPMQTVAAGRPQLREVAGEVRQRLQRVLDRLG